MDTRVARRAGGALLALAITGSLVGGLLAPDATAGDLALHPRAHFLALTNQARESHDKRDLRLNWILSRYARQHSIDMARKGYLFHSNTDKLVKLLAPYHFSIGGENVGVGSNVVTLQQAFMASPPHRENILRTAFSHVAIGALWIDGHMWATLIFYG
jgi:uncharacterized protein YkwD